MTNLPKAPEGTAADLIAAGLKLFGQKGFAATSTRELAAEAQANIASIAYHFGSKDGLRQACGAEVARRIGAVLNASALPQPDTPETAELQMEMILRAMARFVIASREAEPLIPFMLREVGEGGPVLDTVYAAMIEPMHRRFCALWAIATGQEAESEITKLTVFSLIGQVLYFRIGRPIVARRLGWNDPGVAEASQIADLLAANLKSILERERLT
ncbi:CerR family C-terminal domain-containing protein [Defluviimonas aestuarii]|uniref:CerR family C-terminal domain-containing protein n=1 Tax=Albidovulum aestuarii TaxID=1130726 RepID=UPI002499DD2B|nr:CerR family C-terminal domain-containing protein [Defluviimonas aestuarii]MDI3338163.1 CerR family C-terminal domain-containing protein [Defluviimonas aestuarii]